MTLTSQTGSEAPTSPATRKSPRWYAAINPHNDADFEIKSQSFGSQTEVIAFMRKQVTANPDLEMVAVRIGTRITAEKKTVTSIKES